MSSDPLWYKDAIFYQIRVASFYDSDGDGVGDFRGLTQKLDYLVDLGVTVLWLLPFYPSPRRDDGYDIADYNQIAPDYGTLRDFRHFLREAHRRGLRVVTELVVNHTSDQHAWFQRARRAPPGSPERDFYVWSDTPDRYGEARIIFKDFEHSNWAWDPLAKAYYWHRFYSHQPDLNFENPAVREAIFDILDYWFEMGVDGFRLDAVPYLYERENTSCENLPETHAFLKDLRAHVDARFDGRMLLAEANQWPEDAVAYFGKGDECHMAFHFPIMPRLFMALQQEDRYPIVDILEQTPPIPSNSQWAVFLRNHDELTLEMVTDEERDYMWRVYAQDPRARVNLGIRRRLAPLMAGSRRKIEMMNALLLSLPGTPVLYYGDELGMGDNVYLGDRNGVRTPMQWSPDRNAGFSRSNPQSLFLPVIADPEYHYEAVNVEVQQRNPSSLLWWTKRILALRKEYRAFGHGTFEPLAPENRKVLAFVRRHEGETILVVANLSRFAQYVELDLREFEGCFPLELMGRVRFPRIGELPYLLTLGPHAFHWFSIERPREAAQEERPIEAPMVEVPGRWTTLFERPTSRALERILPRHLRGQRWFRGKAREMRGVTVADAIPVETDRTLARLLLVRVEYDTGEPETYVLPLRYRHEERAGDRTLARLRWRSNAGDQEGVLDDCSDDPDLASALLDVVRRRRRLRGNELELRGVPARLLRQQAEDGSSEAPHLLGAEQTNTSYVYGQKFVGKLLRRLDEGASPELEILRHLNERARFPHAPSYAGHLELRRGRDEPITLFLMQSLVPNEGDAWRFTLDRVSRYFEDILAERPAPPAPAPRRWLERARRVSEVDDETLALDMDLARLLGHRTAELHLAMTVAPDDPAFASESRTPFSQRAQYQSIRNLATRVFETLEAARDRLPETAGPLADRVLRLRDAILQRARTLLEEPLGDRLIRLHGDYHLGQVLYTGRDFVIIDFEGEPARSLAERRRKRSPLVDVAGMLRSYHYASESALLLGPVRRDDQAALAPFAAHWYESVSAGFLATYLDTMEGSGLLPEDDDRLSGLLELHLLEKALYEVGYELNNRPDWVGIPLRGLLEVTSHLEASREGPG